MMQYKAGYKFVNGGVHAHILNFPEAITCGTDLDDDAPKREDLLRHLRRHGCRPLRERGHSVWVNPANGRRASIPQHREVNDYTAQAA